MQQQHDEQGKGASEVKIEAGSWAAVRLGTEVAGTPPAPEDSPLPSWGQAGLPRVWWAGTKVSRGEQVYPKGRLADGSRSTRDPASRYGVRPRTARLPGSRDPGTASGCGERAYLGSDEQVRVPAQENWSTPGFSKQVQRRARENWSTRGELGRGQPVYPGSAGQVRRQAGDSRSSRGKVR